MPFSLNWHAEDKDNTITFSPTCLLALFCYITYYVGDFLPGHFIPIQTKSILPKYMHTGCHFTPNL
jgi:hypothetical protein